MQNFIALGQPILGEKYVAEKEKDKKNNHKNSGHFVPLQRLRATHALRSNQNNPLLPCERIKQETYFVRPDTQP